jgi:S-(hydroxymethyl)glutathione dehydrogenase/alcohol dehydrogenase
MSNHCVYGPIVRVASRFNLPNGQTARAICGCGAFAEAMVVDEASVVAVDTFLPDEELALLGCGVTTGVGAALNTAGVIPGSSVVVLGCGGVGQSVIQGARIAGASTIIAVDPELSRRTLSAELGATDALDPSDADPVLAVMELTGGRGADYAFEAVGHPRLMAQAFDMTRAEGTVTLVGMAKANDMLSLSATSAVFSGKTIKGSTMGGAQILRDFPRIIKLVETKQLNLGSMVSQTIGLAEVNDGLEAMKQAQGIRTIIVPT